MTPKQIRGQLRQIVKEMIGEILSTEVGEQLRKENQARLDLIAERQSDIMSYLVRATTSPAPEPKKESNE